ncbi:hypothetical protein HDU93_000763 [Gonapodya sp. JEL0774]|nr:hypothetical protein HDU93_000763 [Gonapodya sp. JEL0774]
MRGIEEATNILQMGQRLLLKGKSVLAKRDVDSTTLADVGIVGGTKLLLVGTPAKAISSLQESEAKLKRMLATRAQLSRAPGARAYASTQSSATLASLASSQYGFLRIDVLPQYSNQDGARDLLNRLRQDPAIVHVMKDHQWTVGSLIELSPAERSILGYNQNKGQTIALRLRTNDLDGFRYYDSVRKVLLHELSHMVWSEHDERFHSLNRQLNKEVAEYERREGRGKTLGTQVTPHYDVEEEEGMDHGGFQGGSFVLGGSSLSPLDSDTREAMRERAAQSALLRATARERDSKKDEAQEREAGAQ